MLAVLLIVVIVVVFTPNIWVRWVMNRHSAEIEGMPGTGGELAQHLVKRFGLKDVTVEVTELGDHYDPLTKTVALSKSNFDNKSLTAVAAAAHEVGHAIQHHQQDARLNLRHQLVPWADRIARLSAGALWLTPIVGLLLRHPVPVTIVVLVGLSGLIARMGVHLITLPIEWDASFNKALPVLIEGQYIAPGEEEVVRKILRAAALTYFASALADILNLMRWLTLLLRR